MRIAILSTLASGGAAGASWRVARALADYGHECSSFILEGSGNPLQIPLLDNENAFWVPALFRRWSALTTPETLAANATELFSDALTALHVPFPLPEAIREAEIIHLRWVAGMVFSPALLSAMAGKKIVWALPDCVTFTGGCHYTGSCLNFQTHCRNCPLLKKSGLDDVSARCFRLKKQMYPLLSPSFVSASGWLAEKARSSALLRNYPVSAIPPPLDIGIFQPPQNRPALRRNLSLPEDAFVILSGCEYLGNPRKNTKILFEALALLFGEYPDLPVTVMTYGYGQPPELGFPVRHFGYMENETRMAELYGAADIFVHTAMQEVLGLTLCEAQACGTPTLCFNVGGCPETMLPGKTGFLVNEVTSQALAEKLRTIITDRDSLAAMREAARTFAVERFDPCTVAAAYTEVFEKAQAAPGLKSGDPPFAELVQNQIASLASFLHDTHKELSSHFDSRVVGIDNRVVGIDNRVAEVDSRVAEVERRVSGGGSHVAGLEGRLSEQAEQLDTLRQQVNTLRWNLRHPLRWFFRKLRRIAAIPNVSHSIHKTNIKFSIITPSFNSGKTIEKAIRSVLSQQYGAVEHIIIDGGSTDNTINILRQYPSLRWISEPDRGQVHAMNKGLAMATGDIIGYLNADDYYENGVFLNVAKAFDAGTMAVFGNVNVYQENTNQWWINIPSTDFHSVMRHWEPQAFCVNPVGYFCRKEVHEKIHYKEENGAKHDLAFLLELAFRYPDSIKKLDMIFGTFLYCADTQTAREQDVSGYWTPENFAFINEFLLLQSEEYQDKFRKDQLRGYAQRERWRHQDDV